MGKRWYGSVSARLEEGHNYNEDKMIHEGDDITVYFWSDQHCKYVTKVIDQKHIFVHEWHVCADHSKPSMSNEWLYFKTRAEENKYLNSLHLKDLEGKEYSYDEAVKENPDEEWVFRYGHWNTVSRFTQKDIDEIKRKEGWCRLAARNDKEQQLLDEGKEVVRYNRIDEGISFGVRRYYYDYEF